MTTTRTTRSRGRRGPRPDPLHVVLVPGLGDRHPLLVRLQRLALRSWRAYGVRTSVFTVGWSAPARFDDRIDALEAEIDRLAAGGAQVALVGASAGAGAVLATFVRRPELVAVVVVTPKFQDPDAIPDPVLEHNDVFHESLRVVPERLGRLGPAERSRVLSLRSTVDGIIPAEDTLLAGATHERMRVVGHVTAIGYALCARGSRIVRFVREQQARREGGAA